MAHIALQDLEENKFKVAGCGKLVNTFADLDSRALEHFLLKMLTSDPLAERKFRDPFSKIMQG